MEEREKKEEKLSLITDRNLRDGCFTFAPFLLVTHATEFPLKTMAFSVYFGPKTPKGAWASFQGRGARSEATTRSPRMLRSLFFFSPSKLLHPPEQPYPST